MLKLWVLTLASLLVIVIAVGCSYSDQVAIDLGLETTATITPTEIVTATMPPYGDESQTPQTKSDDSNNADEPQEQADQQSMQKPSGFWNEPMQGWDGTLECNPDMKFTHPLIADTDGWQLMTGPGSHIAPHDHMVYWGVPEIDGDPTFDMQVTQTLQIYAPTDFYYADIRQDFRGTDQNPYEEWGAWLYTCDGYSIGFGHIGGPSPELKNILGIREEDCPIDLSKDPCELFFTRSALGVVVGHRDEIVISNGDVLIPAGTPLFNTSGYANFDFGIALYGLDESELRDLPTYGYSVHPWRSPAGRSICPLELFEEPMKSEYLSLLGDFSCGPMNQDVPGTAMGYWYATPSPKTPPRMARLEGDDEWDTIWLYEDYRFSHNGFHNIASGHNTFGLERAESGYRYEVTDQGLTNRRWDEVVAGSIYCMELVKATSVFGIEKSKQTMLVSLSEDGLKLTVEASGDSVCGAGPWNFQDNQRDFYR